MACCSCWQYGRALFEASNISITFDIELTLPFRFVIAPLDVIKIRLQLQPHGYGETLPRLSPTAPTYKGILPTMRTIVVQEGIRGLWKGNIPAELLYLSYGAVQFLAYREFNVLISTVHMDVSNPVRSFLAGAAAGGVATSVTYPLDLLRTRFAAQGGEKVRLRIP